VLRSHADDPDSTLQQGTAADQRACTDHSLLLCMVWLLLAEPR